MNRISMLCAVFAIAAVGSIGSFGVAGCSKKRAKTTPAPVKTSVAEPDTSGADEDIDDVDDDASSSDGEDDIVETTPNSQLTNVIYFGFDSFQLDATAREALTNNADWLKEDKSRMLTIEGHTDQSGTTEYNLALGERRARASLEYLVKLGIDKSRIRVITFGEERPAVPDDDAKNRRSVFIAARP